MARLPRLTLPGYPHHVILRGNNRQLIFKDNSDRETLLGLLVGGCQKHGVDLHAFVLMDNHLHLLLTPQADKALSKMMQDLGRDYVRYFNKKHTRTGTLWEGRFRSALIQTDRYFLACMVYIDLNPVRAGMVAQALDHPWSSHAHYTGARQDSWLVPHDVYWALGNTPFARERRMPSWFNPALKKARSRRSHHLFWAAGLWARTRSPKICNLCPKEGSARAKLAGLSIAVKKIDVSPIKYLNKIINN